MNRMMLTLCVCLLGSVAAFAESNCAALGDSDKAKLVDYVQKKYKAPKTATLVLEEISFVNSTCYRQLRFKSNEPRIAFRLDLVLSPDLRFLAREMFDSTVDPIAEARQKREAFNAGLMRGTPPNLGPEKAAATLVVFSDFQCPFCSRAADMLKEVRETDQQRLRIVYRYLPLPMHPWARAGAEAAACSAEQGNTHFWALHDFMFEHQKDLNPENLTAKLIEQSKAFPNFDSGKFLSCLADRKMASRVDEDMAFAADNNIHATPTAFLNGEQIQLVAPEQLRTLIHQLSTDPEATVPAFDKKASAVDRTPAAPTECIPPKSNGSGGRTAAECVALPKQP
jgi:predicted DsbA family dithiol-disulfide isomerase